MFNNATLICFELYPRWVPLKHNTHDLYDLYVRKGVLNTNEHSQCEGQKKH